MFRAVNCESAFSRGFFYQLYQREEEVVKEVTKEDDDARVGSESRRIQIFSVMEELSKQLSLIYHLFSANRLPVNMSFCKPVTS